MISVFIGMEMLKRDICKVKVVLGTELQPPVNVRGPEQLFS